MYVFGMFFERIDVYGMRVWEIIRKVGLIGFVEVFMLEIFLR